MIVDTEDPANKDTEVVWFPGPLAAGSHMGTLSSTRPAQLAELPRSEFDPELFPHSAYVKFFVPFVTKVP